MHGITGGKGTNGHLELSKNEKVRSKWKLNQELFGEDTYLDQLRDSEINENNIEEPEIVLPSVNTPPTTLTDDKVNDSAKNSNTETSEINNPIERRYPKRVRKPPRRLIVEK